MRVVHSLCEPKRWYAPNASTLLNRAGSGHAASPPSATPWFNSPSVSFVRKLRNTGADCPVARHQQPARRALSSSLPLHSRPLRVGEIALRELVTVPSTVDAPADIFGLGSGQSRGRRKRRSRHDPMCRQWRAHLRSRPRARPHQHRVWSRLNAGQGSLSRSKHRPRLKSRVKSQGKSCRIGKMAEK
jgi:hypothetical protein